jgi:hypothetical protein
MATVFYQANPNLKNVGVPIEYTTEQVEEYVKCKIDPIYFIKTYIKIISLDLGLISFNCFVTHKSQVFRGRLLMKELRAENKKAMLKVKY